MNQKSITTLCCMAALTLLLSACGTGQQGEDISLNNVTSNVSSQTVGMVSPSEEPVQTAEPDSGADREEASQAEPQPHNVVSGQAADSQQPEEKTPSQTNAAPASTALEIPAAVLETAPADVAEKSAEVGEENTEMKMNVQIGTSTFTATLEDNAAVDALVNRMEGGPLVIQMSDYAGFEKVGPLGTSLPTSNHQTTTQAGDIVLYQGNQIVIFYGSNSWSYTRLGRIDDLTGWTEALGSGDVTVTFSMGA